MNKYLNKIIKIIKDPLYLVVILSSFNIIKLSDEKFLKIKYKTKTNRKLDLNNPKSFNEKIQWLKLYDRKKIYTTLVDKFEVKRYVKDLIGEEYIIPTIGIYNNISEIDFDILPKQFVLKCTHDSGGIVICKDKTNINFSLVNKKINKCLKKNYYYYGREWPYKNVKPRVLVEKYMVDESGTELKDYKFFCFNGEPVIIQVDFDRFNSHKRNIYDTNWNLLDLQIEYPSDKNKKISKPKNLDKMLEICKQLSKGIPHIRVDLYNINGKIYFGELTFYHGSGFECFMPEEYNYKLGNLIKIEKITKIQNKTLDRLE